MNFKKLALASVIGLSFVVQFSAMAEEEAAPQVQRTTVTKSLATRDSENTWNLSTQPLSLLDSTFNLTVEKDIGSTWTLGLTGFHRQWNAGWISYSATVLGLLPTKHFTHSSSAISDGWYVGGVAYYIHASASILGFSGEANGGAVGARGGYQWVWQNFNMNLGAQIIAAVRSVAAGIDWGIGWAF